MAKVILTKGLPASGKSTWAREQVDKGQGQIKRVSKDDLRAMLDNSVHSKGREQFILKMRDIFICEALNANWSIIVDDTNLYPEHETHIREYVNSYNLLDRSTHTVEIQDFTHVPLDECIRRDAARPKPVGDKVIRDMYFKYLHKTPEPFPYNPILADVVLCDLDGTLALLNGRNPYDASTCEQDLLNIHVKEMLEFHQSKGRLIFLLSGRSDKYMNETMRWLSKHGVVYSNLIMRADGDSRKDSVVKQIMLDTRIRNKYNVHCVIDDRPQVIEMWRSNGLFVFDVNQTGVSF